MEENKVFVPKPPKELRQTFEEDEKVEIVKTEVPEKANIQKKQRQKVKINWNSIINWFGLLVSVAAMIVFVFLLAK